MRVAHGAPDARVGGTVAPPRAPGVLRRFDDAHPRWFDAIVAAGSQLAIVVIGIAIAATDTEGMRWDGIAMVAIAIAVAGALMLRRRWPLAVLIVCVVLSIIPTVAAGGAFLGVYVALYSVGAHARPLIAWIGVAIAAVAGAVATTVMTLVEPDEAGIAPAVSFGLLGFMSYGIAALIGISVRGRRRYVEALIERARDAERERDQQARLAVAGERARIAREMHDVVSHGLTVMVTLAEGAAAQTHHDPERAADIMRRVADTGRDSLGEMRKLLGVLRDPDDAADRSPQPTAGDLPALVASFRDAGMPARLTTSGAAITDQTLALAVHRIVQEGLTNAMRHASDARRVDAVVRHEASVVEVEIVDDGSGARGTTSGAGRGLVGMRERAALFGGDVVAGPREPRGWRVIATLHTTGTPDEEQQ